MQHALAVYVSIGRYQTHLRRSCRVYRKRRDAMVAALAHCLPQGARFTVPQGGLFLWLRLPDGISSEYLLPVAGEEGVAFIPGTHFFLNRAQGEPYLRLSFATQTPRAIEEGIQRLSQALDRCMAHPR